MMVRLHNVAICVNGSDDRVIADVNMECQRCAGSIGHGDGTGNRETNIGAMGPNLAPSGVVTELCTVLGTYYLPRLQVPKVVTCNSGRLRLALIGPSTRYVLLHFDRWDKVTKGIVSPNVS